jgi:hypothetical protein
MKSNTPKRSNTTPRDRSAQEGKRAPHSGKIFVQSAGRSPKIIPIRQKNLRPRSQTCYTGSIVARTALRENSFYNKEQELDQHDARPTSRWSRFGLMKVEWLAAAR